MALLQVSCFRDSRKFSVYLFKANLKFMKKIILLLILTFGLLMGSKGQITEVKAKGAFKQIDVTLHNKAIEAITGKNKKIRRQTVDSILTKPNNYNPPVLYALSRELYKQGKKDQATFWFYTAQLRARYDANLCLDNTAKQAVSILNNEYGSDINKYAFQSIDSLEKTVAKVVDFVRTNEEYYDHRWINLHGMDAVMTGMDDNAKQKELSQPKDKWAEIKKKTIDDYFDGFTAYVKSRRQK
jgi:hypothetical protein